MKPIYMIYEQIEPKTPMPFRLVEINMTCDGPRSRLTNFCFATLVAARAELTILAGKP